MQIHGEPQTFNTVRGTALVTFGQTSIQFNNIRDKLMLTGQPNGVVALAGIAPTDPRTLLGSTGSVPTVQRAKLEWKTKDLPGSVPALSGGVLGYAFGRTTVIRLYDREGRNVDTIYGSNAIESSWAQPTDFIPAGWVGRIVGRGFRSTASAVVGRRAAKPPPWTRGPSTMINNGETTWTGDILIKPTVKPGTALFDEVLRHEGAHRRLTARSGLFVSQRQNATKWFYLNSHFLKYTEEATGFIVGLDKISCDAVVT